MQLGCNYFPREQKHWVDLVLKCHIFYELLLIEGESQGCGWGVQRTEQSQRMSLTPGSKVQLSIRNKDSMTLVSARTVPTMSITVMLWETCHQTRVGCGF